MKEAATAPPGVIPSQQPTRELRSKVIHEEVGHKKVLIVPAVYSLKTGQVEWLTTVAEKKKAEGKKAGDAT